MKYIIANWKAHKTLSEARSWVERFLTLLSENDRARRKLNEDKVKVLIASPFPYIFPLFDKVSSTKNIELAAQDISQFDEGAYTGDVVAKMLQGVVSHIIVGHTEQKKYHYENDEILKQKIDLINKYEIVPILCVQDTSNKIPENVRIVAYDPTEAIGTGENKSVKEVLEFKSKLGKKDLIFLYGGSVNESNIEMYASHVEIDGLLVGSSSLDPDKFFHLLTKI